MTKKQGGIQRSAIAVGGGEALVFILQSGISNIHRLCRTVQILIRNSVSNIGIELH